MKEVSEKIHIKLRVNNKEYPLTVDRNKEEIYRIAERRINERLNLYKQKFDGLDEVFYMSMTMLDLTVRLAEIEKRNDTKPYDDMLSTLTAEIEEALKK